MSTIEGKIALVTGGGSGIGRAIAAALANAGARVLVVGRRAAELESVVNEISARGGFAWAKSLDLLDSASTTAALDDFEKRHEKIQILVNNAGIAKSAPIEKTSDEMWDAIMDLNVKVPFKLIRRLAPKMKSAGWGRIVNIASTAALEGYAYTSAYTASKHALLGMTRAFSKEYVQSGVTVNAVCPGYTRTDIVEGALESITQKTGRDRGEVLQEMIGPMPIGRLVEPDEVAASVLYLCGDLSDAVSGIALTVAGGAAEG